MYSLTKRMPLKQKDKKEPYYHPQFPEDDADIVPCAASLFSAGCYYSLVSVSLLNEKYAAEPGVGADLVAGMVEIPLIPD